MTKRPIFFGICLLLCAALSAQQRDLAPAPAPDAAGNNDSLFWPANVQQQLRRLVAAPLFETTQLGLCVYDLTADSLLFAHGARQRLRPASTAKLLTAIAAIDRLGGNYRFATSFYHTGEVRDTVLEGDVYIAAGFDPAFGHDDLKAFMHTLSGLGVRRIAGHLYADRSFKDTLRWGKGWCWDDEEPHLTPLLFNGKDDFETHLWEAFAEEGIAVEPSLTEQRLPPEDMRRLLVTRFHTLDQILMPMMKKSNNLYAEALFYQLAAAEGRPFAGQKDAATAISRLIRKLELDPEAYAIADGSGLSLYNYASAELLVKALCYAYRNSQINVHLYPSLPVAGVDGTLERRMRRGCAYGSICAKTGTLEGVSSLAGYATAANGHVLAFAILNQGIVKQAQGRQFQDKVCEALTCP